VKGEEGKKFSCQAARAIREGNQIWLTIPKEEKKRKRQETSGRKGEIQKGKRKTQPVLRAEKRIRGAPRPLQFVEQRGERGGEKGGSFSFHSSMEEE